MGMRQRVTNISKTIAVKCSFYACAHGPITAFLLENVRPAGVCVCLWGRRRWASHPRAAPYATIVATMGTTPGHLGGCGREEREEGWGEKKRTGQPPTPSGGWETGKGASFTLRDRGEGAALSVTGTPQDGGSCVWGPPHSNQPRPMPVWARRLGTWCSRVITPGRTPPTPHPPPLTPHVE